MKREEQLAINDSVVSFYEICIDELQAEHLTAPKKRLRSCTAWVYETTNFYILQSYSTVIACIDKETDTCYDFLRYVYGYTSTSGQHITKFRHDYGCGKWGCDTELRYYAI